MNLIYTFTSKLLNENNNNKIFEVYLNSYKNNIRFHNIVLYTDSYSYPIFKDTFNNIELFDMDNIKFTDDYKFAVLEKIGEDDLLIDGDIFLTHPLFIPNEYDVICETIVDNVMTNSYYEYYKNTVDILLENNINDVVDFFSNNINLVTNIGILKFKNKKYQNEYLHFYSLIRNWYISKKIEDKYNIIKNDYRSCAVFAQYLLSLFIKKNNLKVLYLSNYNKYVHLSGDEKYNVSYKKTLL